MGTECWNPMQIKLLDHRLWLNSDLRVHTWMLCSFTVIIAEEELIKLLWLFPYDLGCYTNVVGCLVLNKSMYLCFSWVTVQMLKITWLLLSICMFIFFFQKNEFFTLANAKILLSDCLACDNCMTSEEGARVFQQNQKEFFRILNLNKVKRHYQ